MNYKQKKLTIDEILSCLPEERKHKDKCYYISEAGYKDRDCDCGALSHNECRKQFLDNLNKL